MYPKVERKVDRNMEFPEDVLSLIRAYARPIGLRLDWRTCKRNESRRIRGSNRALLLWYRWFLGQGALYREINEWTFYGRRHLLYESRQRYWFQDYRPGDGWYETRFMRNVHPIPHAPFPIEVHMSIVSLIV